MSTTGNDANSNCSEPFTTFFYSPTTSSTYRLGDTAPIQWYAGIIPESTPADEAAALSMTFSLILSAFRNESYIFNVLENVTIPFSGSSPRSPISWNYVPDDNCSTTEISYEWPIPSDFAPAFATDYDYVLNVNTKNAVGDGWDTLKSNPFRILTHLASTNTASAPASSETQTAGAATSSLTNPPPTNLPASSSLSTGAKAGIAVGSVIGGLALIILGVWLFFRIRRNKTPAAPSEGKAGDESDSAMASAGEGTHMLPPVKEKVELDSREMLSESDGAAFYELPIADHDANQAQQEAQQRDTVVSELSA